jgi:AcrR family transcriptional regulator
MPHTGQEPSRRRDATQNRARIVAAAATVFAERGIGVDVREIARVAGVGMGTLYRHFPTKDLLVDAVLHGTMQQWAHTAQTLATSQDPTDGLFRLIEDALTRHAAHRGLLDGFSGSFTELPPRETYTGQITPAIAELLGRAQETGRLRTDVTVTDILLLIVAVDRIIELTEPTAPGSWRRSLAVLLDGLETPARHRQASGAR